MAAGDVTLANSSVSVTITLNSLANGALRGSGKVDLGATRGEAYAVSLIVDPNVAPSAGTWMEVVLSSSNNATAGTDNDGDFTGADATQGASDTEREEMAAQCMQVGVLKMQQNTDQQKGTWIVTPPNRYATFGVLNKSGQAMAASGNSLVVEKITRNVAAS